MTCIRAVSLTTFVQIAHILGGRFLLVGCTSIFTCQTLSLWDLSLIPFVYSDDHAVAAKTPLWFKETPDLLPYWPPPWIASGIAYQIIPREVGMLIVAVPLGLGSPTSSRLPANGVVSVFEADHTHHRLSTSSSQGVIAYTVTGSSKVDASRDESSKPFVVVHIHDGDDGRPSFTLQRFDIPFRPNLFSPILDMYSSRLVFYGCFDIHLCSLSENY